MCSFISIGWRAQPLVSYAVILSLIGAATTVAGLSVRRALDDATYPTSVGVTDDDMATLNLQRLPFQGGWNDTIVLRQHETTHAIP